MSKIRAPDKNFMELCNYPLVTSEDQTN